MRLRLCYFIMKKYTSRSQHKHIPSCTITITISTFVITVSTFVTRYTFTLLLFEICVYVTSHERIYVTVITYSITHNHNFNIRHSLMLHNHEHETICVTVIRTRFLFILNNNFSIRHAIHLHSHSHLYNLNKKYTSRSQHKHIP